MPVRRLWAITIAGVLSSTLALGDTTTSPAQADRKSTADTTSGKSSGKQIVQAKKPSAPAAPATHPTIERLLTLHNQTRARVGLPPLSLNPQMCASAQQHANWMAATGAFAHSGLPYRENIAYGQASPEHAVQTWTYSPGHYQNMCSGREAGFGFQMRGGAGYWVAVFR
jgi:uncharacterized protein YkwD